MEFQTGALAQDTSRSQKCTSPREAAGSPPAAGLTLRQLPALTIAASLPTWPHQLGNRGTLCFSPRLQTQVMRKSFFLFPLHSPQPGYNLSRAEQAEEGGRDGEGKEKRLKRLPYVNFQHHQELQSS